MKTPSAEHSKSAVTAVTSVTSATIAGFSRNHVVTGHTGAVTKTIISPVTRLQVGYAQTRHQSGCNRVTAVTAKKACFALSIFRGHGREK